MKAGSFDIITGVGNPPVVSAIVNGSAVKVIWLGSFDAVKLVVPPAHPLIPHAGGIIQQQAVEERLQGPRHGVLIVRPAEAMVERTRRRTRPAAGVPLQVAAVAHVDLRAGFLQQRVRYVRCPRVLDRVNAHQDSLTDALVVNDGTSRREIVEVAHLLVGQVDAAACRQPVVGSNETVHDFRFVLFRVSGVSLVGIWSAMMKPSPYVRMSASMSVNIETALARGSPTSGLDCPRVAASRRCQPRPKLSVLVNEVPSTR
jgi:hypothetical protein